MRRAIAAMVFSAAAFVTVNNVAAQATDSLAGRRIALVTGSTDGLGREVALRLAANGAHVIVHGRNRERGLEVVAEIMRGGKGSARFITADFSSLAAVRQFADSILRNYERIDVLVNNAGVWLNSPSRELSTDGHELHFAVNYLAPFTLTRLLLPRLLQSPGARVVNVASVAQSPLDFDDIMLARSPNGSRGYGQSKLALIMFTFDLAAELSGSKVVVNAVHPATLMPTSMVLSRGTQPRSTIAEGADAVISLIDTPDMASGQYFNGMRAARANDQAYNAAARAKLKALSDSLTGRAK